MALELTKEFININHVVAEDFTQTLVEGDIIVPDIKPDILKILQVDGTAVITNREIQQDRVVITGVVNFKILYVPDGAEEVIKSITANTNFTHQIDVKSARQDMKAQIESDIEHIEFTTVNSRKVNVKAVVSIDCKVFNTIKLDMVTDITGEEDVQILRKNVKAYNVVAESNEQLIVKEDMEIPAGKPSIKDLLKVDTKITGKDTKLINGKIVVKGELTVCTLYIGDMDNNSIQFMEHEVPFTEVFDLNDAKEGMHCDLDYELQDFYYHIKEDSDGEARVLSVEASLNASIRASEEVSVDVVVDSYSPGADIKIEKKVYDIDEIIDDSKTQTTMKQVIDLPAEVPEIIQIYNVITKPYIIETKVDNDCIVIDGIIDTYILYLADSEENPVYSFKQELPFKQNIDIKGVDSNMVCDVKIDIDHCSYNMNDAAEIELRCVVGIACKVVKTSEVELITTAEIAPINVKGVKSAPSIVIYFTQQGDTLWQIAKKYHTTIEEIQSINNLDDSGTMASGKQLLIPKRQKKVG
ncbi:MAG: SPOCS domain-containing protein [Clostridia bacterium]